MNEKENNEILLYQTEDGETKVEVIFDNNDVWLTQAQMAELFQRDISVIAKHIKSIFNSGEVDKYAAIAKRETMQMEGGREVRREINYYNLDVIISVGYRINSRRGTLFRIWATQTLKTHLTAHIQHLQELCVEMLERYEQETLPPENTSGYIYAIKAPNGLYKIGRTKNPETRFKSFKTMLPFAIDCVLLFQIGNMIDIEAEIHQHFASKRVNGEWFALNDEDIETLKSWTVSYA